MLVATGLLMPDFDDSRWTVVRSEIPKPLSSKGKFICLGEGGVRNTNTTVFSTGLPEGAQRPNLKSEDSSGIASVRPQSELMDV